MRKVVVSCSKSYYHVRKKSFMAVDITFLFNVAGKYTNYTHTNILHVNITYKFLLNYFRSQQGFFKPNRVNYVEFLRYHDHVNYFVVSHIFCSKVHHLLVSTMIHIDVRFRSESCEKLVSRPHLIIPDLYDNNEGSESNVDHPSSAPLCPISHP